MPGTPFPLRLTEEEIAALLEGALDDLLQRLARRAFHPVGVPGGGDGQVCTGDTGPAEALARLHLLVHLQRAADRLVDRAAREAAEAGAGYPQLGQACGISRQGARRRWPGLVAAPPHRPAPRTSRSPR
ncbi:hypothetical protein [Streptomyces sp. NPDC001380]|uniref:hypothetical protein n=1 Tax=Streptomyces sp. NPDC001380 TaxID=3364566 RepID=UPI0036A32547